MKWSFGGKTYPNSRSLRTMVRRYISETLKPCNDIWNDSKNFDYEDLIILMSHQPAFFERRRISTPNFVEIIILRFVPYHRLDRS